MGSFEKMLNTPGTHLQDLSFSTGWFGLRALCPAHHIQGFCYLPKWISDDERDGWATSDLSHWASKGNQLEAIWQSLLSVSSLVGHFIFQLLMSIIQDSTQYWATLNSGGYDQTKFHFFVVVVIFLKKVIWHSYVSIEANNQVGIESLGPQIQMKICFPSMPGKSSVLCNSKLIWFLRNKNYIWC